MALLNCGGSPSALFEESRALYKQGRFPDARKAAQQGFERFRSNPASEWHWKFGLLAAELQLLNGDTNQADSFLRQDPPAALTSLFPRYQLLRGYALSRRRQFGQAQDLLRDSIERARSLHDFETEADGWLYAGTALLSQDNLAAADNSFDKALQLARREGLLYQQAAALTNRGMVRIKQESYGAAIPFFDQARQIADQSGAALLASFALGNLATCYENLGDLEKAQPILDSAVEIRKRSGLATSLSNVYSEMGALNLRAGRTKEAIRYFRLALEAVHEDAPIQYSLAAGNLAKALAESGSLDEAERYNRMGARLAGPQDSSFLLTEASIAENRGQHMRAIDCYRQALNAGKAAPSVLWQAYAGLAGVYSVLNDFTNADAHYQKTLAVIAANRADQLKSDYKITFLSSLMRFYEDYVAFLIQRGEVNRALEIADSSRASVLTQDLVGRGAAAKIALLPAIQKVARTSNSVFLFYWLAPKTPYLWAISGTQSKGIPLPSQRQIVQDVESYRALIEREKRDPLAAGSQAGVRLYDELVAPAAALIPPGGRVVIVPDGVLHNLNFETLLVSAPQPHYWIEDATISIAPSLEILTSARAAAAFRQSLLLMGDPVMQGTGYQPLPQAALEIAQIRGHFPTAETKLLTGAKATVEAYAAAQPAGFSTIHFATHVDANAQSPLDSAIVLSADPNGFKLYARSVAAIPITADLVTISACRGAGARTLSGEGLVGFAWAFFQARAQNVLTSLWDVYDNSTAQLMDDFYAGVERRQPYASALRDAKVKMLRTGYKRPYYWAPFQLYSRALEHF